MYCNVKKGTIAGKAQLFIYPYIYQSSYGSPEVDHTTPKVVNATVSEDGFQVDLQVAGLVQGHVHDFDLSLMQSAGGGTLVHTKAYYTLNEIPAR